MRAVTPVARTLAEQALLYEGQGRSDPATMADALQRAYERLRWRLVVLVGSAGFAALFSRALRLAQEDFPALRDVTADAQSKGGLQRLDAFVTANAGDPAAAIAGLSAILAHLIGLLVTFIGEDIAVRLVYDAWPELGQDRSGDADGVEERV